MRRTLRNPRVHFWWTPVPPFFDPTSIMTRPRLPRNLSLRSLGLLWNGLEPRTDKATRHNAPEPEGEALTLSSLDSLDSSMSRGCRLHSPWCLWGSHVTIIVIIRVVIAAWIEHRSWASRTSVTAVGQVGRGKCLKLFGRLLKVSWGFSSSKRSGGIQKQHVAHGVLPWIMAEMASNQDHAALSLWQLHYLHKIMNKASNPTRAYITQLRCGLAYLSRRPPYSTLSVF